LEREASFETAADFPHICSDVFLLRVPGHPPLHIKLGVLL
jgi:hypothetical protein